MSPSERVTYCAPYGVFTVGPCPDAVDVSLRGEFDLSSTDTSQQVIEHIGALLGDAPRPIRIEMSAVSFLDAAGIKFVLQLERLASLAGTTSGIHNPSRDVHRLLQVVGLERMLADEEPGSAPDG